MTQWAVRIRTIRRGDEAVVNVYSFSYPTGVRIRRYDAYDQDWLNFIVDSRTGKQPWAGYDMIEGGVIDDHVVDTVEAYINGYADAAHTLRQLAYHKPNYQVCILNQKVADEYLCYLSSERR